MCFPVAINAAAFARATPVAFATNGTVRDALGLASKTYNFCGLRVTANCMFIKPLTPTSFAIFSVACLISESKFLSKDVLGSTQAESPECTPASSICSITPAKYNSSPSYKASTSISIASSRNLSISTG